MATSDAPAAPAAEDDLQDDACRLLAELVRLDTTNPPGNETAAAEHLAVYLEGAGVECELIARAPERANLVARIRGSGDGPALMLLGHTDVVLAEPSEWSVPPFAGVDRDGCIWGRGALDMKGQVAAEAAAMAALARAGFRPNGDLILCAVADEEVGDGFGLAWLVEAHADAVRAEYVLNEGGGERVAYRDRVAYTVSVGEKMSAPFRITTRGRAGHASTPSVADNALLKLIPIVERLERMRRPALDLPELALFVRAVTGEGADARKLLERSYRENPVLAALIEPMMSATLAPTQIEASRKRNVIPSRASVVCDSRLLPGMTPADSERAVRQALSGLDYELEFLEQDGGTSSPPGTPLFAAVERFVATIEPGALAAPMVVAGFTDSHWMREAFGSVAYGFMPAKMDPTLAGQLIHGADERALKDDLGLAARFFVAVARDVGALT